MAHAGHSLAPSEALIFAEVTQSWITCRHGYMHFQARLVAVDTFSGVPGGETRQFLFLAAYLFYVASSGHQDLKTSTS